MSLSKKTGFFFCAAAVLAGCQGFSNGRFAGISFNSKSTYAGAWTITAKPSSLPAVPGCIAQWGPFALAVSVANDGKFSVATAKGSVDSAGAVTFTDANVTGDACGGGRGHGRCATANSCQGVFDSSDGAASTWSMTRNTASAVQY